MRRILPEITVQFSLPLTLRHHHSNNLFCSKYRIPLFFFTLAAEYLPHIFISSLPALHIYSFQPNACLHPPPPPQDKTQPMSTNGTNSSEELPPSPPNVPSKLRNSRRGCEIGLELLCKHTNWTSSWWIGAVGLRCVWYHICLAEVTQKDASAMCRVAPVFFSQTSGRTKTPRGTLELCKYTYSRSLNSDTVFLNAFWTSTPEINGGPASVRLTW